jgi:hypothetical protein
MATHYEKPIQKFGKIYKTKNFLAFGIWWLKLETLQNHLAFEFLNFEFHFLAKKIAKKKKRFCVTNFIY